MARVLVVDDQELMRALVREFLAEQGHEVVEAGDVSGAEEVLGAGNIDLVITDMVMPGRSGADLLLSVKRRSPDLPVVIMTGQASVDSAVTCFRHGARDFLTKPLEFTKLRNVVAACVPADDAPADTDVLPTNKDLRVIAGYDVKRVLGYGNFAVVYLAEGSVDGQRRQVALKVLRDEHPGGRPMSAEARKRFCREASVVVQLEHPNIVRIYEFSVEKAMQLPFIAMEYIRGRTLKDLLPALADAPWVERLALLRQVAAALDHVHERSLIHRDVKPHNVMVTPEGQVKLTDFGVVKTPDSDLTMTFQTIGTAAYLAPESLLSSVVDSRADLFSLGVVAYELLLGRRPFEGETLGAVCAAITHRRPAQPRRLAPEFPPSLEVILARLLRKKPEERYQTAAEVVADMDRFLADEPVRVGLRNFLQTRIMARDWA